MARRNRKNEYLLSGKIRCVCGRTRAGEGPKQGKHLYYRCSDRVACYPLPPTCTERGVNARIADELVWEQVARLMSSKELMLKQVERWAAGLSDRAQSTTIDTGAMQGEVAKLKKQEDRYAKAYAEGLFSIGKLQGYVTPVRERIASLEGQIAKAREVRPEDDSLAPLEPREIEAFAASAARALEDLNFESKRAIVMNVIDKVVATQEMLEVYGYIPITDHVELCSEYRDGANTIRHGRDSRSSKSVPFELVIPLPPPLRRGDRLRLPAWNERMRRRGEKTGNGLPVTLVYELCRIYPEVRIAGAF